MGYYSTFFYSIKEKTTVDLEKVKQLEETFSNNEKYWYGFNDAKLELINGNELIGFDLIEYYSKFYNSYEFAKELSKCIINGSVDLFFVGEDGESWGHRVTKDDVKTLYNIWVTEEEFNSIRND